MKIEFCCEEMAGAFKKDIIKVDSLISIQIKAPFELVLNANRSSRVEYCPYCGDAVKIVNNNEK